MQTHCYIDVFLYLKIGKGVSFCISIHKMNNWNLSLTVYFHRYELNKEYPKVPFNALKQSKIKQGIFINEKSLTKALFSLSDKSDTLPRRGKKTS